jgi:hypothetical protein
VWHASPVTPSLPHIIASRHFLVATAATHNVHDDSLTQTIGMGCWRVGVCGWPTMTLCPWTRASMCMHAAAIQSTAVMCIARHGRNLSCLTPTALITARRQAEPNERWGCRTGWCAARNVLPSRGTVAGWCGTVRHHNWRWRSHTSGPSGMSTAAHGKHLLIWLLSQVHYSHRVLKQ